MEPTVSLPAAVLFLAGAVVTWIVFDTEPPADDLKKSCQLFWLRSYGSWLRSSRKTDAHPRSGQCTSNDAGVSVRATPPSRLDLTEKARSDSEEGEAARFSWYPR